MDLSPAQIDARNALRLHPKPRDRRAVLAGKEALRFRYETKEFFDVDVTTFVDLYARLPPSGLARVALAPDVINNSGRSEDVFNAYWDELYADTRSEEPLLAALFLVEVAEYGIQQISRSGPEASVIANFTRQVSRLKKVLCNSKAMMSRKRPHAEISRQEDSSLSAVHNRHTKKQRRKRKTGHVMEAGQICPGNHPSDPLAEQCAIKEGIHGLRGAGSNAEKHEYDDSRELVPQAAVPNTELCPEGSAHQHSLFDIHAFAPCNAFESIGLDTHQKGTIDGAGSHDCPAWAPFLTSPELCLGTELVVMPQHPTTQAHQSAGAPNMYSKSMVAPGGTSSVTDLVTRTDVPLVSATLPVSSRTNEGSFPVSHF